ncbi:YtxH domain-containing protein [Patescibacteria group bacterium]
MFGKKKKKKKKGMMDKVVMGAIVGGAIGSVVGMTVAPKKGEETRKYLKDKGSEVYEKSRQVTEKFMDEHENDIKEVKKKGGKVWKKLKKHLRKK